MQKQKQDEYSAMDNNECIKKTKLESNLAGS
jgi:hypothetical protein